MNYKKFITKEHIRFFGILAAIGAVSILFGYITGRSICLFYNITGVPCPACGMTRAYKHLFQGHIAEAFNYHPLFPSVIFIPFILTTKKRKYSYLGIALLAVVWIIRLKLMFPNTKPMVYMENNLIEFIKSLIYRLI